MKISFLVTFFNQEKYVKKCIDSILRVKKPCDWEILVGDNGSNDKTLKIVSKYSLRYKKRIKVYKIDIPKTYNNVEKASLNRLNLLEKATGDFFCVIDGDDSLCNVDYIEHAIEVFRNKKYSIVACGYQNVNANGEVLYQTSYKKGPVEKKEYLTKRYVPAGACVFRKCFKNDDYNILRKNKYFDDNDIVIYNMKFGDIFFLPYTAYSYYQHSDSVYNSLNQLEKSLLNSIGYEKDIIYAPEYTNFLKERYMPSLLYIYINKKRIRAMNSQEKKQYLNELNSDSSFTFNILNYYELSTQEKIKLKIQLVNLIKVNMLSALKVIIKLL